MRLIIDAQLPKRLARWLGARAHDVLHTLDLPEGNATPDKAIIELACREERIVVTKDSDFVDSHLIQKRPPKLLLIAAGNMSNAELEVLFERNLRLIENAMKDNDFVELGRENLIVHG